MEKSPGDRRPSRRDTRTAGEREKIKAHEKDTRSPAKESVGRRLRGRVEAPLKVRHGRPGANIRPRQKTYKDSKHLMPAYESSVTVDEDVSLACELIVTTHPLAHQQPFRVAMEKYVTNYRVLEQSAVTAPFEITVDFQRRSLESIAQELVNGVLQASVDITPYVTRQVDPDEVVFYGRYESGAVGGISAEVTQEAGHYTLALVDPSDLLDPNAVPPGKLPARTTMQIIGLQP